MVVDFSTDSHETNNDNNIGPSTSASEKIDIDYDSEDNELFGTPSEKM